MAKNGKKPAHVVDDPDDNSTSYAAPLPSEVFIRFRLSHIDSVMSPCHTELSSFQTRVSPFYRPEEVLRRVPEIRIFGATDKGQRVVAHIHGAFPYVYIEYKGKLDPESVNSYIYKLGRSINHALGLSFKRRKVDVHQPSQYVAFIVLCKGTPIYGYYVGYKTYLKIYCVDPKHKKRMSELLRSGTVMSTRFDVMEDHIPFLLQFMLDTNLYGCGWVEVGESLMRRPLPEHNVRGSDSYAIPTCSGSYAFRIYTNKTVPDSYIHPIDGADKISYCPLELDVTMSAILNRRRTRPRNIHQDFIEQLHPEKIETEKLVHSVRELWEDEKRRCSNRGEPGPNTADLDPPNQREFDTKPPGEDHWQSEFELRAKVEHRAIVDLNQFRAQPGMSKKTPHFNNFVEESAKATFIQTDWLNRIKTTFQQVDAVFQDRFLQDERETYPFGAWAIKGIGFKKVTSTKAGSPDGKVEDRGMTEEIDVDEDAWMLTQNAQAQGGGSDDDDDDDPEADTHPPTGGQRQRKFSDRDPTEPMNEEAEGGDDDDDEFWAEENLTVEAGVNLSSLESLAAQQVESVLDIDNVHNQDSVPQSGEQMDKRQVEVDVDENPRHSIQERPMKRSRPLDRSTPPNPAKNRPKIRNANQSHAKNPFASPEKDKNTRYRFVPLAADTRDTPIDPAAIPHAMPTSDAGGERSSAVNGAPYPQLLENLPSDVFDEYHPTPTVVELPSTHIPLSSPDISNHYQSLLGSEESQEAIFIPSAASSPLEASPCFADGRKKTLSPINIQDGTPSKIEVTEPPEPQSTSSVFVVSSARDKELSRPISSLSSTKNSAPVLEVTDSSGSSWNSGRKKPKIASNFPTSSNTYIWAAAPMSALTATESMDTLGKSRVVYNDPFYSKMSDVPPPRDYAGRRFVLKGDGMKYLKDFDHHTSKREMLASRSRRLKRKVWECSIAPPTHATMTEWISDQAKISTSTYKISQAPRQVEGPTQVVKSIPTKSSKSTREKQHLAILAVEIHVNTRKRLLPDPSQDAIEAIFYCLQSESDDLVPNGRADDRFNGVIVVGDANIRLKKGSIRYNVDVVENELELLSVFVEKLRYDWDPEIVTGYEVHHASWGYILERADLAYSWNLVHEFGRLSQQNTGAFGTKDSDRWGFNQSSTLNFTGRHVIPIWRIMKADNKLQQYSFDHVAFHVLRQRTPHFSFDTLTAWYTSGVPHLFARVLEYWQNRVEMDIEMLEAAETIPQNSESARVFGVDFKSVRTRGSQFKVEAVMFRIAKPESFLLLSPNRQQVGKQNAAECQPLIMEPASAFYKGPMLVLDFQSLYPSIMIAYNYCYSTCLGRVGTFKGDHKFGTTTLDTPPGLLHLVKDHLNISPNGMVFVKADVRTSLLAKMLSELLDTRVMVKKGMKGVEDDSLLTKLLNARQLALKFLANVTYGYTSATFSGRMPCVEIADAIVQTGRETLEKALETIRRTTEWGAEVVYGDTDSLFIYLPGKSKKDAFRIGREMADKITSQNPAPIKLKFEKVYLPSVLLAKKRYVGFKYEREKDLEPEFDAKGIETVRRDGIPATQKMQESCLKILFRTSDLSLVKEYCQRQWKLLLAGDVSPQDFTYAKEVKLGTYSTERLPPPGVAVATRRMAHDPRAEPEYGDRVPYILFQSEAGQVQVDHAISPLEFFEDMRLRLDATHYITRAIIPPLERIFNLLGANVSSWYSEMAKTTRLITKSAQGEVKGANGKASLLEEHFASDRCVSCLLPAGTTGLCEECQARPNEVLFTLNTRIKNVQSRRKRMHEICASCASISLVEPIPCTSLDCPIFYSRKQVEKDLSSLEVAQEQVASFS